MSSRCPWCQQLISEPRSTGERSQNSRVWGSCDAIAKQAKSKKWNANTVYELMKMLAVEEGVYPGIEYKKGNMILIVPISQSEASKKDVMGLIETINKFADEHNFWLWEYTDDNQKYKSIGGRTYEEMMRDYPELNGGNSQEINREARKRFVDKCEQNNIYFCEVNLPGCMKDYLLSWHHRKRRIEYYDRDKEQHIKNLSEFKEILLICGACHDKLQRDKQLSEKYFRIILKRRKENGVV